MRDTLNVLLKFESDIATRHEQLPALLAKARKDIPECRHASPLEDFFKALRGSDLEISLNAEIDARAPSQLVGLGRPRIC